MQPELEKAGILEDDAIVMLSRRRPADVLIHSPVSSDVNSRKVAWDVKVINALGNNHLGHTLQGALLAADEYREHSLEHQDTARRCQENDVRYEPLVFTVQGGIQANAEAILSDLAAAVARAEGRDEKVVKGEILQDLSMRLTRAAAKAVARRTPEVLASMDANDVLEDLLEDE